MSKIANKSMGLTYELRGGVITGNNGLTFFVESPIVANGGKIQPVSPGIFFYEAEEAVSFDFGESHIPNIVLHLKVLGEITVTRPGNITWIGAGIPVLTDVGKTYVICFEAADGAAWRGNCAYKYDGLDPKGVAIRPYPTDGLVLDLNYKYSGEGLEPNNNNNIFTRGTWTDISGNGNHAKLGRVEFVSGNGWGEGLVLNSTKSSYAQVLNSPSLTLNGDFTFIIRFYFDKDAQTNIVQYLVCKGSANYGQVAFIVTREELTAGVLGMDVESAVNIAIPSPALSTFALTVDRANRKIAAYLNGELKSQTVLDAALKTTVITGDIIIGGAKTIAIPDYFIEGIFKNIMVYNRALSAEEIAQIQEVL